MTKLQLLNNDESFTVKRVRESNRYKYVDGFKVRDQFEDTLTVIGNMQPIGGFELMKVPENERTRDPHWLWTRILLRPNDIVIRSGEQYEVTAVQDWNQQNLKHYQCRVVKRDA